MISKSKRCFVEKCFLCFYSLFCFGLCLYNIYKICEIYFAYKTTTFVKYQNISKISLPAITLCVSKVEVWKNYDPTHPSDPIQILKTLTNLTIKQQFEQLYEFQDIFHNCSVIKTIALELESLEPYIDCYEVSPIRKSIDYDRLCFTLFTQLENESNERFIFENNFIFKDFLKFMAIISIKTNVSKVSVAMHPRDELVRDFNQIKYVDIRQNYKNGSYSVSYVLYRRIISHSIPKPYETQCVDYRKKGYNSRSDCIYQCRIKHMREKRPLLWPGNFLNYENFTESKVIDMFNYWMDNYLEDVRIGDSCKNQCELQSECYSELYEVSVHQNDALFPNFYLPIFPPDMPDLIYKYSPSVQLVEFLSYLGSAISLFFGFSVIMLSDLILKFSKYVWNKYFQLISVNNQILFIKTSKQNNRRRIHSGIALKRSQSRNNQLHQGIKPELPFIIDSHLKYY